LAESPTDAAIGSDAATSTLQSPLRLGLRYVWPGLPTGRIVIKARWAGDDTHSPVIASITR